MSQSLEVRPISGALGAEVPGVDLGACLDDATVREIRRALLDHGVIFFRDQRFDAEQQKALARRFGEIFVHPNYAGTQADPEIVLIRREPGDTKIVGEDWHTDTTMMAGAADGRHPLRDRDAAVRRRHAVRQPVPCLRGAVGRHEATAGRSARRPHRPPGGGPCRPA